VTARVTNLYLVRHGEAEINVRRVVGGQRGDTGLTERGFGEARRLGARLLATGEIQADVLISSTLLRARQTAEIIASALGKAPVFDDDIEELRPGEADGLPLEEAMTRYGVPDFERDPGRPVSPGGESWAGFMRRVGRAIDRIATEHEGRTVVLVTHGGVVDGAFVHFLRMQADAFLPAQFATRHTSLTHWQRRERWDQTEGWRLVVFNDVAHLR
jgi:probable phosphoglycerate mutase